MDLSKQAKILAEDATAAEKARLELLKHAEDLAEKASDAEQARVDLSEHAKLLAEEASSAEKIRIHLSEYAQKLAGKALDAEEIRIDLSKYAEVLADKAIYAEKLRLDLSEHAKELAIEAENQRISKEILTERTIDLSDEIVKRTIAEQQLKIIINTLPIIVWVVDTNGVFTMCEGKGLVQLGLTSGTLMNTSCYNFFPPSEHEHVHSSLDGKISATRQVQFVDKTYSVLYCPLTFNTGIIGVVVLAQDITKQRKLEEQKQALILREKIAKKEADIKSKFLANMSHEMRTPLYGVMANIEFLLESRLNKEQKDNAEIASQSVTYISKVVNDILDISMLESNAIKMEHDNFRLRDTLNHAASVFRPSATVKGLDFDVIIDKEIPVMARGDPDRVQQILTNLINNAIKFTESGSVVIHAVLEPTEVNKMISVWIHIKDTGIGMSVSHLYELFNDFTQADSSTTRPFGGIGSGVKIAEKLSQMMGGSISVKSQKGKGSLFSIKLKFDREHKTETTLKLPTDKQPLLNRRFLINEDNLVNQKIVKKVLNGAGAESICVDNALVGFEKWRDDKEGFDLILMDCHMPVMDGYDGTKLLRKEGCELPIIALTANALKENLDKCISVGMNDFITKPTKPKDLIHKIGEWLK